MKTLYTRDLSPIEVRTRADEDWLRELQEHVRVEEHVFALGGAAEEHDPIVACGLDGRWRAGRYVGTIALGNRRLVIRPRFGHNILEHWIGAALNLVVVPRSAPLHDSETVIPLLLALIWCREFDAAARHGLPFLRVRRVRDGVSLRGRLSVERTIRLRAQGRRVVSSEPAVRSLDHDIARTIVCAHRALGQMLGSDRWMTDRVRQLMPHLWAAVGTRPRLPSRVGLARIRYTPIRVPFRGFVERSWRIARQQGFSSAGSEDGAEGVLLDVAELWELFIARCAERAFPDREVVHGSLAGRHDPKDFHLRSVRHPDSRLGLLIPDVVVTCAGETDAIIDAKYKLLRDRSEARDGVLREDRFQLAAYLGTLGHEARTVGLLAYPLETDEGTGEPLPVERALSSRAERDGPWETAQGNRVVIHRLPVDVDGCVAALRDLLGKGQGTRVARST